MNITIDNEEVKQTGARNQAGSGGSWFDGFDDESGIGEGLGSLKADEHTVGLWDFDDNPTNHSYAKIN